MSSSGYPPSTDTFCPVTSSEGRTFLTNPIDAPNFAINDQEVYSEDQWNHGTVVQQPTAQYTPLPRTIAPSVIHYQSPFMETPVSNQQFRPENGYHEILDFPDDPGYYNGISVTGSSLYELDPTQFSGAATNWNSRQVEHSPAHQSGVQGQFVPMERDHSYQSTALHSTDSYQDESRWDFGLHFLRIHN
jgi:hypothetical protein